MSRTSPDRAASLLIDEGLRESAGMEEPVSKTHRGVLADLSREERVRFVQTERRRRICEAYEGIALDVYSEDLAMLVLGDGGCFDVDFSEGWELPEEILKVPFVRDMEQAKKVAGDMVRPTSLRRMLKNVLHSELELVKVVLDHGGRVELSLGEFIDQGILNRVRRPLVYAFRTRPDMVTVVVPQQMREALAQEGLFEECLEGLKWKDAFLNLAVACCELYGVVSTDELFAAIESMGCGVPNEEAVAELLRERASALRGRIGLLCHGERQYLVGNQVFKRIGSYWEGVPSPDDRCVSHGYFACVLEKQEAMPRYVPEGVSLEGFSLKAHIKRLPEYGEAQAYLDSHVPEWEDEYFYAEDMLERTIRRSVDGCGLGDSLLCLEQNGVVFENREEYREFAAILVRLLGAIPRWECNGWSYRDMIEGRVLSGL